MLPPMAFEKEMDLRLVKARSESAFMDVTVCLKCLQDFFPRTFPRFCRFFCKVGGQQATSGRLRLAVVNLVHQCAKYWCTAYRFYAEGNGDCPLGGGTELRQWDGDVLPGRGGLEFGCQGY